MLCCLSSHPRGRPGTRDVEAELEKIFTPAGYSSTLTLQLQRSIFHTPQRPFFSVLIAEEAMPDPWGFASFAYIGLPPCLSSTSFLVDQLAEKWTSI